MWQPRDRRFFPTERAWKWWNTRYADRVAGITALGDGSLTIKLFDERHSVHRVIWAMVNGIWPADIVRHRDGDKTNNRISNLFATTRVECQRSIKTSATGVPGVYVGPKSSFIVDIWVAGRSRYIGTFACIDKAKAARLAAERVYR